MDPIAPKAVLFLDDEQSYVELMTQLLSDNLDCPIRAYTRPHEALAALPRLDVALIVTDYSMPVMNGIDFLHRAHAVCPQVASLLIPGPGRRVTPPPARRCPRRATMIRRNPRQHP